MPQRLAAVADSFLVQPDSGELFSGPKVFTVNGDGYAAIRLAAGQHSLTLTSERPFMVVVVPSEELDHG
jgi:hypothetical protein